MTVQQPSDHEHIDDDMIKMEVNLDDMSGEWLGYIMDVLLNVGANDVFYTPIYMKKNRPGILLQLLCSRQDMEKIKQILFQETTTFGIRYFPMTVHRLERRFLDVHTKWGYVRVKQGIAGQEVIQSSPEFADCKAIAEAYQVPLKQVYEEVWRQLNK